MYNITPQDDLETQVWKTCPPQDLWVMDKLIFSRMMGYTCGPVGMDVPRPDYYVVRPCVNALGMGAGMGTDALAELAARNPTNMLQTLASNAGELSIGGDDTLRALADTPRYQSLGLDSPRTAKDAMTPAEELATLEQNSRSFVKPNATTGNLDQEIEILPMEIIKKNKTHWFKRNLETPEAKGFFRVMELNRNKSAIHPNSKTGVSMDFSTDCPERLSPCPYCYVEVGRGANKKFNMHGNNKALVETPYRREILAMPEEMVNKLNAQGGLRANSFGDYRPVQDYNNWMLALQDAEAKGLYIKAITKQPELIQAFGDHPNFRANISVDYLPRNISNSPTLDEAIALKAGRDNIKIRTVAFTEEEAWEMGRNPNIDVITLYHSSLGPDKLFEIIKDQSPALIERAGGEEALMAELKRWKNIGDSPKVSKRLAEAFPDKICCQSGKCGGDKTKCGFGMNAAGGILAGVYLFEPGESEDGDSDSSTIGM